MKKILFVSASLGLGGSERCMTEMIRHMDLNKYDITVLALLNTKNEHCFDDRIRIINGYEPYEEMSLPFTVFLKQAVKNKRFREIWYKLCFRIRVLFNRHHLAQDFWQELSGFIEPFKEEYDVVIGYGQGFASYFAIDKVPNASKKILWLNTDLEKARYNIPYVSYFYEKADAVFTDSQNGVKNLNRLFPKQRNVIYFPNMMDDKGILEKAKVYVPDYAQRSGFRLLTVGRLCEAKAIHLAISAASILKQKNFEFVWYILGDGSLRKALEEQLCALSLQENVIMLGKRENPYPWFAECDIYIQTSVYEGSCMTLNEAMLFGKPIVTTNFPAAYEKIRQNETGLICEMTPEDIADKIEMVLTDKALRCRISEELRSRSSTYDQHWNQLECILNA